MPKAMRPYPAEPRSELPLLETGGTERRVISVAYWPPMVLIPKSPKGNSSRFALPIKTPPFRMPAKSYRVAVDVRDGGATARGGS